MSQFDAFAPPKATVADVEQPKIPGLFKGLLIAFFVLTVLGDVLSMSMGGLVWLGVMAIAAWRTFEGSRAASRVLAALLVVNAVLMLVAAAMALKHGPVAAVISLALALYMGVLAGYIFFNPAMQAVFRKADARKWQVP
jgi:hypothetical protein